MSIEVRRQSLPFEPRPIDVRLNKLRPASSDGRVESTSVWRVWRTAEGRRCKFCPSDSCTLKPVPEAPEIATCLVVVWGDVLPGSAATLRVD